MDRSIPFVDRIGNGSGLLTGWIGLPDPLVAGHLAQEDFDALVLDMQHGHIEFNDAVLSIAQAALYDVPVLIRIAVGGYANAARLLDSGAAGIIAPIINSADDARAFVDFVKYPPLGSRSWAAQLALDLNRISADDYLKTANRTTLALAMIETREGLAALDDILDVPGIDGIFVGPFDLSIALTGAIQPTHPKVEVALDQVLAACRQRQKLATVMAAAGERARELIGKGYDLIAIGPDHAHLRAGASAALNLARGGQTGAKGGY